MSLNVLKDIRRIYAALDPAEIRASSTRGLNIGLASSTEMGRRGLERFLTPASPDGFARTEALRCMQPAETPTSAPFDFLICEPGVPVPKNGYGFDPAIPDELAHRILADHADLELVLARHFAAFRKPAADRIVMRTARENALFALVTALPNVAGIFELPWAPAEFATDTAFLTMNQIRMALLLAAVHGRTVGYGDQKSQIAAIAAGAFGWRALARELAGKIPLGGGLIPKAAIAFAGTYVVGIGLEKLNRTGTGLSRRERRQAYRHAFHKGKEVALDLLPAGAKESTHPQEENPLEENPQEEIFETDVL